MDFDELEREALTALRKVALGQIFLIRDLFEGHRWESLPKGDRLDFGRHFKRKVTTGAIQGVEYVGKAQNGSAEYVKIEENDL